MTSDEIRKKFLDFFESRGHTVVPSSSLVPDDPSVLLTTAGMQQFKRYFTGELDPMRDFKSKNTASVQKSFRTSDIDEVGDESHLTFFEMLGNFSFGEYFKKEAVGWGYEFLAGEMGFTKERLSGTYLKGDSESLAELKKYIPDNKIRSMGKEDNSWGPTGNKGPCGPTVEFYVDGIEVWNLVFNENFCHGNRDDYLRGKARLEPLKTPGVDTGMGLERLTMASQNVPTIFETDLFAPIIGVIPEYMPVRTKRIIADHVRGIAFLLSDGVRPSNKEAGYILRRLMRRVIVYFLLKSGGANPDHVFEEVFEHYNRQYPELNREIVLEEFNSERTRFEKTLDSGLKELERVKALDAPSAFKLYESFGVPYEVIKEFGGKKAAKLTRGAFNKEFERHREVSKSGQEKKFGGHGLLLDTGELKAGSEEELRKVTRLHTATHLLHRALREVLGDSVRQMGSDITVERTRFDFSFPRKLTPEERSRVEKIANKQVERDLAVLFKEMPLKEAEGTGALHFFKARYPERVKVYYIAPDGKGIEEAWSKEFCGGPHVGHTGKIGKIKISKEEAVGAGIRRIRATVE